MFCQSDTYIKMFTVYSYQYISVCRNEQVNLVNKVITYIYKVLIYI